MTVGTSKANGTSMKTQFYWTTDNNLEMNSIYFYKLKIIANDGSFVETDEIQLIIYELLSHLDSHRPNPFFTNTFIEFTLPKSSDIEFRIIEKSSGIEYFDLKMFAESGIHEVEWQAYLDAPNNDSTILRPGVYIANLKTNDTTISKGMLLDFKFNESNCEIPLHIIKTDKNGRFEIDWKWVPELAHYTRIAEDGTALGIFLNGDSGEIIARKFVSENDNTKKYLIGRHAVVADRNGKLNIKLTAKEVEVKK
jgi:hypothetical protein